MPTLIYKEQVSRKLNESENGTRVYTDVWLLKYDDYQPDIYQVFNDVGILKYSAYPTDAYALCRNADADMVDLGGYAWNATYTYSNAIIETSKGNDSGIKTAGASPTDQSGPAPSDPTSAPGQSNSTVSPELRPWSLGMDFVEVQTPVLFDQITGAAVVSSAGQPFDPPIEVPTYRSQITLDGFKTIASDTRGNAVHWVGRVNSAAWLGFAAGTLLCKKYHLQTEEVAGFGIMWHKTLVLEVKRDGWNPLKVLDQGSYYLPFAGDKPTSIKDAQGHPDNGVKPLNGSGRPLSATQILSGDFVFLEFNVYNEVTFNGIL